MRTLTMFTLLFATVPLCGFVISVYQAAKKPQQRGLGIACAVLCAVYLGYSVYCIINEKIFLSAAAVFQAGGMFCMILTAYNIIRYKNCTFEINATYISCKKYSDAEASDSCTPLFFYVHKDKEYRQYSFISYQDTTHNKLYKPYHTYTIFIDPAKPYNCVDKRVKPLHTMLVPLLLGFLFLVLSLVIIIFGS